MKTYILAIFALSISVCQSASAQVTKLVDTIFVRTYNDQVSSKFYSNYQNQLRVNFFFNVKWDLYKHNRSSLVFGYQSPKKQGINEWSIKSGEDKNYSFRSNYFTLEQFALKLKQDDFRLPIFYDKVQIIMLYGEKCSTKFDIYPVKLGTDLSSEG